jgi:hypothetical protein
VDAANKASTDSNDIQSNGGKSYMFLVGKKYMRLPIDLVTPTRLCCSGKRLGPGDAAILKAGFS